MRIGQFSGVRAVAHRCAFPQGTNRCWEPCECIAGVLVPFWAYPWLDAEIVQGSVAVAAEEASFCRYTVALLEEAYG